MDNSVDKDTNSRTNIDELKDKFRREMEKIHLHPSAEEIDNTKQTEAKRILEHSMMFADNVVKHLVAHTIGKEVTELFDECVDTKGSILISETSKDNNEEQSKYLLGLDIVPKDYMLDLKHFHGNGEVKERIVFLLNTVKTLYCPIKDHMKKWAMDNDTTFNYVLQIGLNTTLFLDKDSEKRIGITLTPL